VVTRQPSTPKAARSSSGHPGGVKSRREARCRGRCRAVGSSGPIGSLTIVTVARSPLDHPFITRLWCPPINRAKQELAVRLSLRNQFRRRRRSSWSTGPRGAETRGQALRGQFCAYSGGKRDANSVYRKRQERQWRNVDKSQKAEHQKKQHKKYLMKSRFGTFGGGKIGRVLRAHDRVKEKGPEKTNT